MPLIRSTDNYFGQLQYPLDMEAGDTYFPEAIHFNFVTRLGADLNKVADLVKSGYVNPTRENNLAYTQHLGEVVEKAKQEHGRKNPDGPKWDTADTARISEAFRGSAEGQSLLFVGPLLSGTQNIRTQNAQTEAVGDIYLNMPNNISLSEEAGWGGESLGVVGALTKSALKADESSAASKLLGAGVGSAGNIIAAAAGGIVGGILSKIPHVSGAMGGFIGAIAGGTINRGIGSAFSITQNPYMEMMFSGIGFRQFKFDFIFRARNKKEIDKVADIIKKFRQHSRPTWNQGSLGTSFMNYPGEYQIEFLTLEGKNTPDDFHPSQQHGMYSKNKYLPTLKPCICSAVETNFTPDSIWSAYKAGAPIAITLGLTFSETELVMANDIAEEYPKQSNSNDLFNSGQEGN